MHCVSVANGLIDSETGLKVQDFVQKRFGVRQKYTDLGLCNLP